jgi:hypothetical protein
MAKRPKAEKTLEQLQKEWYAKLEKSGFEDIEDKEGRLKKWSSDVFGKKALVQNGGWQAKAAYYEMAERFLAEYQFADNLERTIWEYHTNAVSVRDIAETLNKAKVTKTNRQAVWLVVNRLVDRMKKMYLVGYQSNEQ